MLINHKILTNHLQNFDIYVTIIIAKTRVAVSILVKIIKKAVTCIFNMGLTIKMLTYTSRQT